jgi:hypothetical protein
MLLTWKYNSPIGTLGLNCASSPLDRLVHSPRFLTFMIALTATVILTRAALGRLAMQCVSVAIPVRTGVPTSLWFQRGHVECGAVELFRRAVVTLV